jgi:Transposase, Mutator family
VLKRSWAGEVRNVSLLVAIGVNGEGYREILGICEGAKEDKSILELQRHLVFPFSPPGIFLRIPANGSLALWLFLVMPACDET